MIFERFARGGAAGAPDGAGLGLAIVAAIAEAHGGRVESTAARAPGADVRPRRIPVDPPAADGRPT